jgi:hypothetical protein
MITEVIHMDKNKSPALTCPPGYAKLLEQKFPGYEVLFAVQSTGDHVVVIAKAIDSYVEFTLQTSMFTSLQELFTAALVRIDADFLQIALYQQAVMQKEGSYVVH